MLNADALHVLEEDAQDRDDLVAYLDGELDEERSRALEARLSLDPAARAEAESLRKTWELLDYLPRAEPSASFTNRTLEKLAVQHTTAVQPGRLRRWPRWLAGMAWAAGIVVAAAGGLELAHLQWSGEAPGQAGCCVCTSCTAPALFACRAALNERPHPAHACQ